MRNASPQKMKRTHVACHADHKAYHFRDRNYSCAIIAAHRLADIYPHNGEQPIDSMDSAGESPLREILRGERTFEFGDTCMELGEDTLGSLIRRLHFEEVCQVLYRTLQICQ